MSSLWTRVDANRQFSVRAVTAGKFMTFRRALSVFVPPLLVLVVPGGIPIAFGVWIYRRWNEVNRVQVIRSRTMTYSTSSGNLTVVK